MKPIRLTHHALGYMEKRGFSFAEVEEAIMSGGWQSAELNKLECRKEFAFNGTWNGSQYAIKQVRPIFVEDESEIVVITVYTYYY